MAPCVVGVETTVSRDGKKIVSKSTRRGIIEDPHREIREKEVVGTAEGQSEKGKGLQSDIPSSQHLNQMLFRGPLFLAPL